jgi:hypothetical protein
VLSPQKVDGLGSFIDGTIAIAPRAFHLDLGFVPAPPDPHRPLAAVTRLFQLRTVFHDPAVDRGVIHGHAALLPQRFDMPMAQERGPLPVHARKDHLLWEIGSLEADHSLSPTSSA